MFGRKTIKNLQERIELRDLQIKNLVKELAEAKDKLAETEKALRETHKIISEYTILGDATPADCKRGEWCRGCEFAKHITFRSIFGGLQETYFCGKAESCSNFVQKER